MIPGADRIEMRRPDELVPNPANPKTHPDEQIAALAKSIRTVGFAAPILVRGSEVIAGHGRLQAAKLIGLERVPVVPLDELDDEQAAFLLAADNRLGDEALAPYDTEKLAELLGEIEASSIELESTGWSADDLGEMLNELERSTVDSAPRSASTPQPAAAGESRTVKTRKGPPPKVQPFVESPSSRVGDVWNLGSEDHRLAVGDFRERDRLKALTVGDPPEVLLCDPPYSSGGFQEGQRAAGTWGTIAADDLSTAAFMELMRETIRIVDPTVAYVFGDWRQWAKLCAALEAERMPVRGMTVWNKGTPALGALWRPQHELVAFGSRAKLQRQKGRPGKGNVITCTRSRNSWHYTEKPVRLIEEIIEGDASSGRAGLIVDAYAGSATTLHAAANLRRRALGFELEPSLADSACARWQEEQGTTVTLQETGETWAEVRARRLADG